MMLVVAPAQFLGSAKIVGHHTASVFNSRYNISVVFTSTANLLLVWMTTSCHHWKRYCIIFERTGYTVIH